MGNRLSKVVTRTGDRGETGLADGSRRPKNDRRIHCLGEIDELNAVIGVALSLLDDGPIAQLLFAIQHDLFDIGAELCQPGKNLIVGRYAAELEASAAQLNAQLSDLKEFILPGGSPAVAQLQFARTVCRRAERSLVDLRDNEPVNPETNRYINRLSDLLFILARAQSNAEAIDEIYWDSKYSRQQREQ